jgi:hypothetical protein
MLTVVLSATACPTVMPVTTADIEAIDPEFAARSM